MLTSTLYDLDGKCRATEDNLNVSRRDQGDLRFSNQNLQGQNGDIQGEIDALQHHCNVLIG
jgi:hypothetical protein